MSNLGVSRGHKRAQDRARQQQSGGKNLCEWIWNKFLQTPPNHDSLKGERQDELYLR